MGAAAEAVQNNCAVAQKLIFSVQADLLRLNFF